MLKRKASVILMVVMALVLVTAVAYATTIIVNGDPTDWPGHSSCTIGDAGCALIANDPAESASTTMPQAADVRTIWATNDPANVFFRFDTEAATAYSGGEFARICLDIPAQVPGQSDVGGCIGHNTDRMILITDFGSGVEARTYDCNTVNCNLPFATPTGTGSFAVTGVVNELSLPLALLGLSSSDDGATIGIVSYFDGNGLPPDDNIPDSGTINWTIGTGSPTALTLESIGASVQSAWFPFALGTVLMVLFSTGLVINRKRKSVQ